MPDLNHETRQDTPGPDTPSNGAVFRTGMTAVGKTRLDYTPPHLQEPPPNPVVAFLAGTRPGQWFVRVRDLLVRKVNTFIDSEGA